jgi:hypothetical protein
MDPCWPEFKSANTAVKTTKRVAIIPVRSKYFSELISTEGTAIIQWTAKLTTAHKEIIGAPYRSNPSTVAAIATK